MQHQTLEQPPLSLYQTLAAYVPTERLTEVVQAITGYPLQQQQVPHADLLQQPTRYTIATPVMQTEAAPSPTDELAPEKQKIDKLLQNFQAEQQAKIQTAQAQV